MAKKVATPSKTRPLQDATNAEGPGAAARSGPGPMPPRSPLSEALAGGLARATANGVWQRCGGQRCRGRALHLSLLGRAGCMGDDVTAQSSIPD